MSTRYPKTKRPASAITPAPPGSAPGADLPPPPKRSKKEVRESYFGDIPPWDDSEHRIFNWNPVEALDLGEAETVGNTMHSKKIRRILFDDHPISDKDLVPMAKGMEGHPSLEDVRFRVCRIGDKGAAALAEVLKHPRCRIYKLDLDENRIGHQGFLALAKAAAANRSLWTLRLRNNLHGAAKRPSNWVIDFASSLTRSPSLRKVFLGSNSFTDEEAQQLFITWANGASVRKLEVGSVPQMLSDGSKALDAFMALVATPDACPTHLKIKNTGVGKEFWEKLPKAVAANPRLHWIEIKEPRSSEGEYPYGIPTEEAYNIARNIERDVFKARGEEGKSLSVILDTTV